MDPNTRDTLFSTGNQEWRTPLWLLKHLEERIGMKFVLDAAATDENALCKNWYTKEENALVQDWVAETRKAEFEQCVFPYQGMVWCNPPYGRNESLRWAAKGYESCRERGAVICMLLPARTDAEFFHRYIAGKAFFYIIESRLKFSNSESGAPFPSIVALWGMYTEPCWKYGVIQQPDALFRGPRPSTAWRRK